MVIASDGFVFVPRCVDDTTLQVLRAEADSLFRLKKRSKDALSEDEYFDKGCALDFFTTRGLAENDEARVSMDEYMSRRNGAHRRQSHTSDESTATTSFSASSGTNSGSGMVATPSASSSTASPSLPRPPASREDGAAVPTANPPHKLDSPNPQWTENHVAVVRDAIFGALAGYARDALKAAPSAAKTHAAGATLLLFNEQYVVKPPQSSIEFGWHTDEREQLAMCVFAPGAEPPVYVSVWLALDDCDAVNGCLEVLPQPWDRKRLQAPTDEHEPSVLCLPAKAGAAVVFLSNVWHRSGPNQTDQPRRVFYAQYSLDVIRAAPSDPRPLSLAVPCLPKSCCSASAAPGEASPCGMRDAGGGDVGARNAEGATRPCGEEVVTPPRGSGDGVDGCCSVGDDGRRQHAEEGDFTRCRSSSPVVDTRSSNNVVSTEEKPPSPSSDDVVDGAMATRRRRRPEEEGVKRGAAGEDRSSKRLCA